MNSIYTFLDNQLDQRKQQNLLRKMSANKDLIDFCSNDYLGFSRSSELKLLIENALLSYSVYSLGSTGSRLISGNSTFTEELESDIADFHNAEAGLICNSGFDANVGLFSSIAQRGDTIITDELIHASIIDGIRLSSANRYTFRHNDLNSLEAKLKSAKGRVFIAVESIYSMDGDEAPLNQIADLATEYGAALIVDEAHATGLYGYRGKGLITQYNLEDKIFARVVTFGKALGSHGAIILGNNLLRSYLINFSRSFIYSTAAPFHNLLCVKMAYQFLKKYDHQETIRKKIATFKSQVQSIGTHFIHSGSAIQSILIAGNDDTRNTAKLLQAEGFDIKPILSPTVPQGKERIRICLHTFNTDAQITALTDALKKIV